MIHSIFKKSIFAAAAAGIATISCIANEKDDEGFVQMFNGSDLTVILNGEKVNEIDLSESAMKDRPLEGYISFQDEGKRVWYRNVRIKELNSDEE